MASLRACYEHDKGRKRKEAVTGDRTSPTEDTMPDITMCQNDKCPLKDECYRHTATPDPYLQSYSRFNYVKTVVRENQRVVRVYHGCEHFIDNKPYIHQTK
jgi:hypothetical protein